MSKLFHINPETGEARPCGATHDRCPFGSADAHFGSVEEARSAYEATQGGAFDKLKWEQTARGWERGSFVVTPNTRTGGWSVMEFAEINGKMVPANLRTTKSSLKGAKAIAVELEELKIQDAAEEGARRGKVLLDGIDKSYRREQRKKAEADVDSMEVALDGIIAKHKDLFPPVD